MALGNFARAEALLKELRELRNKIILNSRGVILSAQSVDMSSSDEGGLLMNTVLAEAEKVAEMIAQMNQLTRELFELQQAHNVGVDLNACAYENEMAAACLQEIFKLLPQPDDSADEEKFFEEVDRLLANEEEINKRQQYSQRIRTILNITRGERSNQTSVPTQSPSPRSPTSDSQSSKSSLSSVSNVLTGVVLPVAGGLIGGLIFGPAGLLLGFKSLTMLGACAAVGAGVGVTAGAGIHFSFSRSSGSKSTSTADDST